MKKKLLCALIALSLTSCDKSDDIQSLPKAIDFNSYTGVPTSRAKDKSKFMGGDAISVSAFKHDGDLEKQRFEPNFFNNLLVTAEGPNNYTATEWTYDDTRFWPTSQNVSFVASHNHPITVEEDGSILLSDFSVKPLATEQVDLLWSGVPNKKTTDGVVNFTFEHALSRIVFTAKLNQDYQNARLYVTGITVNNVVNKGTYTFGSMTPNATAWAAGSWTPSTTTTDKNDYSAINSVEGIVIEAEPSPIGTSLLLLPQDIINNKGVTITVTYKITFGIDDDIETNEFIHTITPEKNWKQNTQYDYNLIFSIDNAIMFGNVTCSQWDEPISKEQKIN